MKIKCPGGHGLSPLPATVYLRDNLEFFNLFNIYQTQLKIEIRGHFIAKLPTYKDNCVQRCLFSSQNGNSDMKGVLILSLFIACVCPQKQKALVENLVLNLSWPEIFTQWIGHGTSYWQQFRPKVQFLISCFPITTGVYRIIKKQILQKIILLTPLGPIW